MLEYSVFIREGDIYEERWQAGRQASRQVGTNMSVRMQT